MPVIINDLEVILERPDSQGAGPATNVSSPSGAPAETTTSPLTPMTLENIERYRRERAARIRAH